MANLSQKILLSNSPNEFLQEEIEIEGLEIF